MNKNSKTSRIGGPSGINTSGSAANQGIGLNQDNPSNMANLSGSKGLKGNFTKIAKNTTSKKVPNDLNRSENLIFLSADGLGDNIMSPDYLSNGGSASREIEPDSARQRNRGKKGGVNFGAGSFGGSGLKFGSLAQEMIGEHLKQSVIKKRSNIMTKPGDQVFDQQVVCTPLVGQDYPDTPLDSNDYLKRLRFEELKRTRLEEMCNWKQKDVKGSKKSSYIKEVQKKNDKILSVAEKEDLEKLEVYTDRFPLLKIRKNIKRFFILIHMLAKAIITSKVFDNASITVIIANSVLMTFDDPTGENSSEFFKVAENVFLALYSIEMVLKILGMGFIMGEGAYLKDSWNILDFIIVISSYPSLFAEAPVKTKGNQQDSSFSLGSLRAFRVMRPLKTISSIKGLKVLMQALFSAMPLLKQTILILMFFAGIFAIGGQQLLSGELKRRCIAIQTGIVNPDDIICGGTQACPGGHFCGKTNDNPNQGVTNFDNVAYSMLCVFQAITLEGWSDVQSSVQRAFNIGIFLYFLPLVFIGAFFLLNLTLAVINAKFTEAHKEQAANDRNEQNKDFNNQNGMDEMDTALSGKDEMSIAQFITAKIYVKKMIEFLRMRQEIKRIEAERIARIKAKQHASAIAKQNVQHMNQKGGQISHSYLAKKHRPSGSMLASLGGPSSNGNTSINSSSRRGPRRNGQGDGGSNGAIIEEDGEYGEQSEQEKLDQDIQDFIKKSKIEMQRTTGADIQIPKPLNNGNGNGNGHYKNVKPSGSNGFGNGPTMKGNIGPTKIVLQNNLSPNQKNLFSKIAEEFDIDNVIPERNEQQPEPGNSSLHSFDLSIKNEELDSQYFGESEKGNKSMIGGAQTHGSAGFGNIPGLNDGDDDSGLITSDSDFEEAQKELGYTDAPKGGEIARLAMNIKKDVSKTFKKMLTSNHNRSQMSNDNSESTKYGGSQAPRFDDVNSNILSQTQVSEIESKFLKKKDTMKKRMFSKLYQEDEEIDDTYLEDKYRSKNSFVGNPFKTRKEDIRQLEEFVSTKSPKDPFKGLNPLTEKVSITGGLAYYGTSQNDVFQLRIAKQQMQRMLEQNQFIKLPEELEEKVDPDFADNGFIRNEFEPYQLKIIYDVYPDTSDFEKNSEESENEDELCAEEQPYQTATRVGFYNQLTHVPLQELARRSDVMLTSTLAMSLFPKDKRLISQFKRCQMSNEKIQEYIDEKCAFQALVKENSYQSQRVRDKEKIYRENYMKSFIYKSQFNSNTLTKFKQIVMDLNKNAKKVKQKSKDVIKQEKIKYEQNKRASEKKGNKVFDMKDARSLIEGKYHEEDEEGEEEEEDNSKTIVVHNKEELDHKSRLEEFENQLKRIMSSEDPNDKKPTDEIPRDIRAKFALPENMGKFEINFNEVRKTDASKKKKRPMWSGQDVLRENLDHQKSVKIIDEINAHRVWPLGFAGFTKRIRYVLRIFVKGAFFDNFMTFAVLLNTITLSMDKYGIEPDIADFLYVSNKWFTYIFLFEFLTKIMAIGVSKYCGDSMNLLDGSVVLLSMVEELSEFLAKNAEGGGSLSSLKTIRMLRTFRVFRIARLLRALESMQTILGVMARSYKSFIYITALMFLFVFIFMLLGMNIYGGKFGKGEDVPRGNFDTPAIAFITVFQILTMENWQSVMFDSMNSDNNKYLTAVYYVSWIFMGNFILLNLFLAILLDSFLSEEQEDSDSADDEVIRMKKQKALAKQKRKDAKRIFMGDQNSMEKKIELSKKYFGQQKGESEEDLEELDEDQVVKIFQENGMMQKDKNQKSEIKMYDGVDCESSLYLFSKENFFRRFCYKLIKHPKWETTVQVLIALSSIKLAVDTYFIALPSEHPSKQNTETIDIYFNIIFIIEMLFKLIAQGLIMDNGSYLRDSWNQLDFFIVTASIADMTLSSLKISAIKILRMLRTLRPLRFLNHNVELKLIVVALMESVGHIFNVLIVVAVVFLIFAIVGVNIFSGKFFYCSIDMYQLHTERECLFAGGQWLRWDHNFDDVKEGMITLYVVSSLEGWPDIMIQAIDTTSEDEGPKIEANQVACLYFVLFILIGSFFFLNFFIGVLFLKFNQAQSEEKKGFTDADMDWKDIQRLILSAKPQYESTNVPKHPIRKKFHDLVSSKEFDVVIMFFIVLNMFQMALQYENMPEGFKQALDIANYFFSAIFLIEAIFKMIAFGWTYFDTPFNKFDFFVVCSSILDVLLDVMQGSGESLAFIQSAPQIAKVMRVLRVTRVVRLVGKAEGLQAIIQTIQFSIPSLMNVMTLLILIFFMFSILGNFCFFNVTQGEVISELKNFSDFLTSFLLLFALSTGEDWNKIMFDCSRTEADGCIEGETCGLPPFSYWYFIMLVLVCSHVMLNLFILVIIEQFERYYLKSESENMILKFQNDLQNFEKVWKKFTQTRYNCQRIKENQLTKFFRELGDTGGDKEQSLGFSELHYEDGELKKLLLKMAIKSDNGYIYFNELLYRCMRRKYGAMKINKKMQIYELTTQFKIYKETLRQQKKTAKLSNQDIYNSIINKKQGVNPFLTVMNFKISFKTWIKFARQRIRIEEQAKADGQDTPTFENYEYVDDQDEEKIEVEIEIESLKSYTSDEDSAAEDKIMSQGTMKKQNAAFSKNSASGSLYGSVPDQSSNKKKIDHLKIFEKRMTQKFKNQIEQKLQQRIQNKFKGGSSMKASNIFKKDFLSPKAKHIHAQSLSGPSVKSLNN